ncbi:hypothetical protein [Roseicyclus sp.]|uniref:hypothetical protein n=1 Tax=Roseicyclus sp. TaxID=1914329 RepID=UPI003FA15F13
MIVEDNGGPPQDAPHLFRNPTAREMLLACATEAAFQADALVRLDAAVGQAVIDGAVTADPLVLQAIDLLRQEARGFADLLGLVAAETSPEAELDGAAVAACMPVAAQRHRLMS